MEFSDKKLNIFQRGILQKCITFLTYTICASIAAFFIDWIDKQWFLAIAKKYYTHEKISEEMLKAFSLIIESRNDPNIFFLILLILICGFLCFVFMRYTAQLNLSSSVTLMKVIEFRKAMESI